MVVGWPKRGVGILLLVALGSPTAGTEATSSMSSEDVPLGSWHVSAKWHEIAVLEDCCATMPRQATNESTSLRQVETAVVLFSGARLGSVNNMYH